MQKTATSAGQRSAAAAAAALLPAEGVQQSRTILKEANLLNSKENTSLSTSYDVSEQSEHTSSVLNGHLRSTMARKKRHREKERGSREEENETSGGCRTQRECEIASSAQEADKSPFLMVSLRNT